MKQFTRSIIFLAVLAVINYFHPTVEKLITRGTGRNFAVYIIYGIFAACFTVVLFRSKIFVNRKSREIGLFLLCGGLVFFFLLSRPFLLAKLTVLELFLLGIFLWWDGKSAKSYLPFILLIAGATTIELTSSLNTNTHFYIYDAWKNTLFALSGYLTASLSDS